MKDPRRPVGVGSGDAAEDVVRFDHVMMAVDDPEPLRSYLVDEWGLHVHPDSVDFADGVSNLIVPLEPPQYLEILYVRDAKAFVSTDDVALVETLRRGGGLAGVVLRTWNIAEVGEALGQPPSSGPSVEGLGSPPWTLVSKPAQPRYPHYIQYGSVSPRERLERWRLRLIEAAHRHEPGGIAWVEMSGSLDDLTAWLAPARHLDIRVEEGTPRVAAAVRVGDRLMVLSSEDAHPTVGH